MNCSQHSALWVFSQTSVLLALSQQDCAEVLQWPRWVSAFPKVSHWTSLFFPPLPPHVDFKTWSVFRGSQQWFTKGKSGLTNLISPTMRWPAWSITGEQWMFTLTSLSFVIVSHYITKDRMTNYGFNMWTAKWIKNCTTNPRGLWPVTQSQVEGKSLRLCPRTLPSSGLPQCKSDADLLELYLLWPSTGSQRWLLDWSISHIRRYWDSWVCSVRREEGSGILSMSINSQCQRMKTRD